MHFKPFCLVAVLLVLASVSFVDAKPVRPGRMLVKGIRSSSSSNNNNNVPAVSSSNNVSNNNSNSASSNNASSDNNSSSSDNSNSSSNNNSDSSSNNSNSASNTNSASAPARTRPCDQGDQSLAAALQANVVIALGQQASVVTLQSTSADQAAQEQLDASADSVSGIARRSNSNSNGNNQNAASNSNVNSNSGSDNSNNSGSDNNSSNNSSSSNSNSGFSADFQAGVDRLNQFMNTSALAIQAAQAIADDDSFAQPQLALLADQSQQLSLISQLTGDANTDNSTLTSLLQLFVDAAGQSQDGVANALIDCFLPLTTVSG